VNILTGDELTQLAFSMYESKGVFALLLGSGLSRSAEIPTGWEITLDLIRRVALAQGVEDQPDWATWYRLRTGLEPEYSAILQELALSPEERRSILNSYIEPTEEDRAEGRKVPTSAHEAIADLVRGGYVRVIITTNFDRLMENALRERSIEPTVIASVDALAGAEPITHSACYVLKLHGDYKDARILNTDAELSAYPDTYNALLDRIFDEHGLVVCGWSGEWDHALRAAFLRAPNRRYTTFWAARGELGVGAKELVNQRHARVIPITDADRFFSTLLGRIETIQQTHRQNPLGIEVQVNSAKRFLSKSEYRIQLDELFSNETNHVIAQLDAPDLSPQRSWDQAEFRARVKKYEAIMESLATMIGVLGRWGDGSEFSLVLDVVRSLYAQAEKAGNGLAVYLRIRSYPAVLAFTAYALGLTRSERWSALHSFFNAVIDRQQRDPVRAIDALFLWAWKGTEDDAWKQIEELDRRKTPLSDHLLDVFSEWAKRFLGLASDFELMFERFEMLGSLAYLEKHEKTEIQQGLASNPQQGWTWMPTGRAGWHSSNARKLLAEFEAEITKAALLEGGFGKGDSEFIDAFIANFNRVAGRMSW